MIIKIFQIKEHIEIPVDQSIQEKYLQVVLIFITLKMVNNLMIKKLIFKNNHYNKAFMRIYRKKLKLIIIITIILIK